jgi:hypothetical protein
MSGVEHAAHDGRPVRHLRGHAQHARHARHPVVGERDHQLRRALALALPDPGGPHPVTEPLAQRREAGRVALLVAGQVLGLGPERPVVRAQVQRVEHGLVDHAHPRGIHREALRVRAVVAVVAVLHDHRQPGRTRGEVVDLDRLVQDDAVGAEPAPAMDRRLEHGAVADAADVGLRVHDQRDLRPGLHLTPRHLQEGALGHRAIRDRALPVAGVSFAPEAVHHQVGELHQHVAVELGGQQGVELRERALELGVVVPGLHPGWPRPGVAALQRGQRDLRLQEVRQGQARGLDLRIRELHAERHPQPVPARGIEGRDPHG